MAIGPDKSYPLGGPINPIDRGGLYAGFTVIKNKRLCVMQFGTVVDWLAATPAEMTAFAAVMRQRTIAAFGRLPYNKKTLPIKVRANQREGVIELRLPKATTVLAANPEMWLALAEVIEDTIAAEFKHHYI